jgi:phenylacetic acid degradation operon negative regulatory protein
MINEDVRLTSLWNVQDLAARYRRVLASLAAIESEFRTHGNDRNAFLMRFAVVFDYLGVAWDDPDLPEEILPADWPAPEARMKAATMYERLLPHAVRYADQLLDGVVSRQPSTTKAIR